jgi:uncharacterized membrane protein
LAINSSSATTRIPALVNRLHGKTHYLTAMSAASLILRLSAFLLCLLLPVAGQAQAAVPPAPILQNDAILLGILLAMLGLIFYTAQLAHPFWKRFYSIVPALLLCYFLPSLLNTAGLVDPAQSKLYFVSSRYLLPAALVLFTLSLDMRALLRLGPKSLLMFLAGTLGVMLGAVVSFGLMQWLFPATVSGEIWRGLSTIGGSWIGGGANQAALKEVFQADEASFSMAITVDVLISNLWMALLLLGAGHAHRIDARLKADTRWLVDMQAHYTAQAQVGGTAITMPGIFQLLGVAFGATALAHAGADWLGPYFAANFPGTARFSLTEPFFWLVVLATTAGLLLSFTRARDLELAGASRFANVFLYILIATIGMKMDIGAIMANPLLFLLGLIWIGVHAIVLVLVARLIRAPYFMLAVGSQANIGGTASASIVASAFHPALAPIGVLLAVLGYLLGTYCGYLIGLMLQAMALAA